MNDEDNVYDLSYLEALSELRESSDDVTSNNDPVDPAPISEPIVTPTISPKSPDVSEVKNRNISEISKHIGFDLESILLRIKELEEKSKELDHLKSEIGFIKNVNSTGLEVVQEIQDSELASEIHALDSSNINIPYLQRKFEELNFKKRKSHGRNAKPLLESEILEIQKKTSSARGAARKMGVSYPTYVKYCKLYNIHRVRQKMTGRSDTRPNNPFTGKYPLNRILENKYPNFSIYRLKDKLIRAGIKKAECEQCGYCERRLTDGKIAILLNFKDDDRRNHRLENLQILCYNCSFTSGRIYIKKGVAHYSLDPDVLQGASFPIKARH